MTDQECLELVTDNQFDVFDEQDKPALEDKLDSLSGVDMQDKKALRYLQSNSELDMDSFINDYKYMRSLGMTQGNAALLCGITPSRFKSLLFGSGISVKHHRALLEAELQSEALFELYHLKKVKEAESWQSSAWMLEKLSKRFSKKPDVTNNIIVNHEEGAIKAAQMLSELRAKQKTIEVESVEADSQL